MKQYEFIGGASGVFGDGIGAVAIKCLVCGRASWNPNDVQHRFCGACERHHDDYLARRILPDGRELAILPLTFGRCSLGIGHARGGWFDDLWEYEDADVALEQLQSWDGAGEPEGWTRHAPSGRCRPKGDPAAEYVRQ